ncbi:fumarylacetoacetate hydrolase family protein [Bradyrhizobium liaoningense]
MPFGVFSTAESSPRVGIAIGGSILGLALIEEKGLIAVAGGPVFTRMRGGLSDLQEASDPRRRDGAELRRRSLVPMNKARLHLLFYVRSFTDFYASREHATNVGTMFRDPKHALMPNWLHLPVGYNGRASTVVVSGTDVRRPLGQTKPPGSDVPVLGLCRKLDIELELGAIVGTPSRMGWPITTAEAEAMIFGYVLLNDWSVRDIQTWEYQPLGPFVSAYFTAQATRAAGRGVA